MKHKKVKIAIVIFWYCFSLQCNRIANPWRITSITNYNNFRISIQICTISSLSCEKRKPNLNVIFPGKKSYSYNSGNDRIMISTDTWHFVYRKKQRQNKTIRMFCEIFCDSCAWPHRITALQCPASTCRHNWYRWWIQPIYVMPETDTMCGNI